MTDRRVVLYLVDDPKGHPLQYWSFEHRDLIRIGRALDNDVVVPHPCVSRSHLSMRYENGAWRAQVMSQHGILLRGLEPVFEATLETGVVFRLGRGGPYLKFARVAAPDDPAESSTIDFFAGVSRSS